MVVRRTGYVAPHFLFMQQSRLAVLVWLDLVARRPGPLGRVTDG